MKSSPTDQGCMPALETRSRGSGHLFCCWLGCCGGGRGVVLHDWRGRHVACCCCSRRRRDAPSAATAATACWLSLLLSDNLPLLSQIRRAEQDRQRRLDADEKAKQQQEEFEVGLLA